MQEISKTYSPHDIEKKWYPLWEDGGYFKPRAGKEVYSLIMPPPNVTGVLHTGHALDITTQDILIRHKRMQGYETLWIPGTDHAGISTQTVIEKKLKKEQNKTRFDIGREKFLEMIWDWKEKCGDIIVEQQKALGASADWDYNTFTMDPHCNAAVKKIFTNLFNEGLIYQSDYIVNWSTELQSAISDIEVVHKEVKGAFYHIKYPLKDSNDHLIVATTRPETLFGDTAVAVHPEDERFKHLIGKKIQIPLTTRFVPIIGDEHVDRTLGTGCLKVTPGHDFNDFEIGKRHNLPILNILNKSGTLNEEALEFKDLMPEVGRKKIVQKLKELNLLLKEEEHVHQVGHCERTGAIIEPLVSKQWFLNTQEMSKNALNAVKEDKTRFYPKTWENTYFAWLKEPKDWCISRQLWWGHRIPVFTCGQCQNVWASEIENPPCPQCNATEAQQDPDVLDTWFSSGLWPFSTLGWPNPELMKQKKFDRFFPTTTLVTGLDIIFFWVARMMMMTLHATKKVPFEKIYIHAIVRDKLGRKMSKSLGNGIDPLEIIGELGADALRLTLAAGSGHNRNLNLDVEQIKTYRNFINKIWNTYRFIAPFIDNIPSNLPKNLDPFEKWIVSELNTTTQKVNAFLEEFRYDESVSTLTSFVYDKFCSYFIEVSKTKLYGSNLDIKKQRAQVLKYALKKILALLHPFIPYVTEEIHENIRLKDESYLIVAKYPAFDQKLSFPTEVSQMNNFIEIVTLIRNLRSQVQLSPKVQIQVSLISHSQEFDHSLNQYSQEFEDLAQVSKLSIHKNEDSRPKKCIMGATPHYEVIIPLDGLIDIEKQIQRVNKDLLNTQKEILKLNNKLENPKFKEKAPDEIVQEVQDKKELFTQKESSLKKILDNLN